jgi:putative SOS response-associated peptidase YedK
MCGRYTYTQLPAKAAIAAPAAPEDIPLQPRYNMAPTQGGLVRPSEDAAHYHVMRWGLIPHWAKDAKIGYKMINARLETVLEKPAFRQPVRQRRVAVWADGFYEWKQTSQGKQPYRITRQDEQPFHFAGLADRWRDPDGRWIDSFTILTTEPNALMAEIHNRMPVMLAPEQIDPWLDPDAEVEALLAQLGPYPADLLRAYPVGTAVGNVRNESPALIEPQDIQGRLF